MHWTKFELSNLTEKQKNTLDCHRLIKTRYEYTGCYRTRTELVLPFECNCWKENKEVLPPSEAHTCIKYFAQNPPVTSCGKEQHSIT
jgi:hypothetical protein